MARLTEPEAIMLAYISSFGPLGTELLLNVKHMQDDLGYAATRSLYLLLSRLKGLGLVGTRTGKRHWGLVRVICYSRPEAHEIVGPSRKLIKKKSPPARVRKSKPTIVLPNLEATRKLIPYVGAERRI